MGETDCGETWDLFWWGWPGSVSSVQFSHSVVSDSLQPHESQHARPPCPSPTPRVYTNSCPSSQWCHPAISSSVVPFSSCPQSLQHQGLFQWVNSSHEVAKVLDFQLQHQSFQWTPRFSKSLIQFSVVGGGRGLCSLPVFDLRPNYGGGNEDNGDLLQKSALSTALSACNPAAGHRRPTPLLETPGHSQASLGQSLVGSLLLSPGSGAHEVLFVPSKSLFSQSCGRFVIKSHCPPRSNSLGFLSPFARFPRLVNLLWVLELS